ncbi:MULTISPECIES: ATP-binding cassette domain-containing protein [unclassified Streptomyces]|uniref:ATP-binding cassette domain-containing protein n=1 Tax=unclassified Streptomyces TaxID=2593676 RepID=UPI0035E35B82
MLLPRGESASDVRGLRGRDGDPTAVDGLDLRIRPGEVVGILGPNGAGKSTTVEILQGHRSRDGGTVRVLGADPATADGRRRSRIGIVRQDESAPAELTVKETAGHFARSVALRERFGSEAAQGFRSVFLPDSAAVIEQTGAWEPGRIALVPGAWCLGGLALCLLTFRWRNRR